MSADPQEVADAIHDQQSDPDVIPAGATQPTTTPLAQEWGVKILKNVDRHEADAADLKTQIENNAERARNALIQAQQYLTGHHELFGPQPSEIAEREAAAITAPKPGAGVWGAPYADFSALMSTRAADEAERRQAERQYLETQAGLPWFEQQRQISKDELEELQKRLDTERKADTSLGRSAMTALGRWPGNAAMTSWDQSQIGKKIHDVMGPAFFKIPGNPMSGPSDEAMKRMNSQLGLENAEAKAKSGIDEGPPTPEELFAKSQANGVPMSPNGLPDVWALSTHNRQNYLKGAWDRAHAQFDKYPAAITSAEVAKNALLEFNTLNAITHTGPELSPTRIGGIHGSSHGVGADLGGEGGININPPSVVAKFKENIMTMDKDAARVVSLVIPTTGFGRVTNRDLQLFQAGTIGTDKGRLTNDRISQGLRLQIQNDEDYRDFAQSYFSNHLTLDGAPLAWQEYLDHNPIFDPKSLPAAATLQQVKEFIHGGHLPELNGNRQGWREYFQDRNLEAYQGGKGARSPAAIAAAPPAQVPSAGPGFDNPRDRTMGPVPPPTPADNALAVEPHAAGGRVGLQKGGQPEEESRGMQDPFLQSLLNGLAIKLYGHPIDEESPGSKFAGEMIGGGLTGAGALMALRRPRAVGEFVREHPLIASSGAGAGAGAIAGQMGGGDPLSGAASGAVYGPMASIAARHGWQGGAQALDKLRGDLANKGTRAAVNTMLRDTQNDPSKAFDVMNRDAQLGVPTTLGEAAGPRSTTLTAKVIGRDTPQSANLAQNVEGRQTGAPGRVEEQVNQALKPDNYFDKTKELRDALYASSKPLFDSAFSMFPSGRLHSPVLDQILSTPAGSKAAATAYENMQNMRIPLPPLVGGKMGSPSLQYYDEVGKALDRQILQQEASNPRSADVLRNLRDQYYHELDQVTQVNGQSPYASARQHFGGELAISDALREGREQFTDIHPEALKARMAALDFSGRDAYRTGVAEALFDQIKNSGANQNVARTLLGNPELQQKLQMLFDNPKDAQKFIEGLQREAAIFPTGERLSTARTEGMKKATNPDPLEFIRQKAHLGMSDKTAGQAADVLGIQSVDPDAKEKLARLQATADRLRARAGHMDLLGIGAGTGIGVASTPTPTVQENGP
jgi:hypothetical protein